MKSFASVLLVATSALATCPCPNPNFLVRRHIDHVAKRGEPDVRGKIWGTMKRLYTTPGLADSAFTVFNISLARGDITNVREQSFEFDEANTCMHGTLKGAQFVIDDFVYQADLEFRGYALPKGVSTEICNCVQTAGNKGVVDICDSYLLDNTEFRMNDVACGLTSPK